jgi:hypothetical protein
MIHILLQSQLSLAGDYHQYAVAGQRLLVDRHVAIFEAFRWRLHCNSRQPLLFAFQPERPIHQFKSWLAGAWREVISSRVGEAGYHLRIEGVGEFSITADGNSIAYAESGKHLGSIDLISEAMLGPALSMALAIHNTFCLHASALLVDGQAILLMGESGAGKSTLAEYLSTHQVNWQRIADDVLPITDSPDGPLALPHFPQLKLPAHQQIGANVAERIPVGAIYLLDVPTTATHPALEALDYRTAAATLVRHTLATSLFDAPLLKAHIDLCASAAACVSVKRLVYPHTPDALSETAALLAADQVEKQAG